MSDEIKDTDLLNSEVEEVPKKWTAGRIFDIVTYLLAMGLFLWGVLQAHAATDGNVLHAVDAYNAWTTMFIGAFLTLINLLSSSTLVIRIKKG